MNDDDLAPLVEDYFESGTAREDREAIMPLAIYFNHARSHEDCQCEGKRCKTCETVKCIHNFYRDKQNKDGHTSECKWCRGKTVKAWKEANRDKVISGAAWYHNKSKRKHYRHHLKHQYGLTEDQHAEMISKQQGACAICRVISQKTLLIDHDHKTGKVRALLCNKCNGILGYADDSIERLEQAIGYLKLHRKEGDDSDGRV